MTVAVPRPPRAVASIVSVPLWPPLVNVKGAWPEASVGTTAGLMCAESGPVVTEKVTGTPAAAVPPTLSTVAITVWSARTSAVVSGGVIVMVGVLLVFLHYECDGYRRESFWRASSAVNLHSTLAPLSLRARSQAPLCPASVSLSGMRPERH